MLSLPDNSISASPVEIRLRLEPTALAGQQQAMMIQSASVVDGKVNGDLLSLLKTIFSGKDLIHNNASILHKKDDESGVSVPVIAASFNPPPGLQSSPWPDISKDQQPPQQQTFGSSWPDTESQQQMLARNPMIRLDAETTTEKVPAPDIETMPPDGETKGIEVMDSSPIVPANNHQQNSWKSGGGPVIEVSGDSLWSTYPLPTEATTPGGGGDNSTAPASSTSLPGIYIHISEAASNNAKKMSKNHNCK